MYKIHSHRREGVCSCAVFVPCVCTYLGNGLGNVGNHLLRVAHHEKAVFSRFYTLPVICDNETVFVYFDAYFCVVGVSPALFVSEGA